MLAIFTSNRRSEILRYAIFIFPWVTERPDPDFMGTYDTDLHLQHMVHPPQTILGQSILMMFQKAMVISAATSILSWKARLEFPTSGHGLDEGVIRITRLIIKPNT
jgi:hypothetical protein